MRFKVRVDLRDQAMTAKHVRGDATHPRHVEMAALYCQRCTIG